MTLHQSTIHRIFLLTFPIIIYCVFLFILWFIYAQEYGSSQYWGMIGLLAVYLIPPLGKEFIIPGALGLGHPPWVVCCGIILMDIVSCVFISLNFDLLEKIPLIGGFVRKFMESTNEIRRKNPWVEKLSYLGLFVFMCIPLQGSGASTTTIFGKLLGVKAWATFWIVVIGSILSTVSVEIGTRFLIDQLWN